MRKILLPILSTILTFASFSKTNVVQAQTRASFSPSVEQHVEIAATQWQELTTRYYQTLYRTKFTPDNSLLSLQDVRNLLGDSGVRYRVNKHDIHQYWYWRDSDEPEKKIEAVFIYHQLIGLRSRGFDRQLLQQIRAEVIERTSSHKR